MSTFYAVVAGDPLDSGAGSKVIEGTSDWTIEGPDGLLREKTYLGQEAWCDACKSVGVIVAAPGAPNHLREYNERLGAQGAFGGDLVRCQCERPPRIIATYARCFTYVDEGDHVEGATEAWASSWTMASRQYDEQFRLRDRRTHLPLANVHYRIRSESGEISRGVTDSLGNTERIVLADSRSLIFEIAHDRI
ncbi:hypothetical protein [Burkholderia sp. Ac-20353]|uniref:hypothetical protein n=1 Tax=Burkholderia sp. Ac-20353 TaxID=2703894 RepID=UPI00197BD633|nr:hypothetical protein [Burkholderia sp. Ac-20353]MBN3789016.1 hypothetical protein [Burkholderia sp. Ac-20353]